MSSFSLLGRSRSRFRSGRFGGGGAAGELVLDCQSCPVYHLDGLIVLQSQLSSLENCVDLHSKKPQMQLHLWCIKSSGDDGRPITLPRSSFILLATHLYGMCGWQFTCMHTNTRTQNNLAERSPISRDFGNTLTIHPELQKVFFFSLFSSLEFFLPLSRLRQCGHAQDVQTFARESSKQFQLSCSEAALYASVIIATDL